MNKSPKLCYSAGPAPRTDRGKRRHAARTEQQQRHAKLVWEGGYSTVPVKEEK